MSTTIEEKEQSLILRDYDNDEILYPIDDTLLSSLQAQKELLLKKL